MPNEQRPTGLSWEHHVKLGDNLRVLRDATINGIEAAYGWDSEVATLAREAQKAVNALRSALDFIVIEEFTKNPDAHKVYYGRD
jgi:hypothetical protein